MLRWQIGQATTDVFDLIKLFSQCVYVMDLTFFTQLHFYELDFAYKTKTPDFRMVFSSLPSSS